MATIYAAGITFYEANNGPSIEGHEAINELISKLQAQWPAEFKFELSAAAK